jgi:hypothetical protein
MEAMRLVEVSEFIMGDYNEEVGRERLKLCPMSYPVYLSVIAVRLQYANPLEQMLRLLKCAMKTGNWEYFDGLIARISREDLGNFEMRFVLARSMWERGHERDALDLILGIDPPEENAVLASKICYFKGQWASRSTIAGVDGYAHLARATQLNPGNYKAWYRWGWLAATRLERDHSDNNAAIEAIHAFLQCVKLRPDHCFPDLIEVVTIFFTAELTPENFEKASGWISALEHRFLLRICPQLLANLSGTGFVPELISELLRQHFHVLLYPLLLQLPASAEILNAFRTINPIAVEHAETIRSGLLKCSSPLFDKWLNWIAPLLGKRHFNADSLILSMERELNREPTTQIERLFYQSYRSGLISIFECIRDHREIPSGLRHAVQAFQSQLQMISVLSFAPELCKLKHSVLAIPGTYVVDAPIVTISHFLHSISWVSLTCTS